MKDDGRQSSSSTDGEGEVKFLLLSGNNTGDYVVKAYLDRWWVLFVYGLLTLTNALQWISFAPLQTILVKYYSVSTLDINLLSLIFMAMMFPFTPVASWALDKFGLKPTLCVAAVLNTIGAALRVGGFRPDLFWLLFAGQTVAAIAQPFAIVPPPKVAAVWFKDTERGLATTLGTLANILGVGIGFGLGPMIIHGDMPVKTQEKEMFIFLLAEAAVVVLSALLVLVTIRSAPPLPPSHSAYLQKYNTEKTSILTHLRLCFTSLPFVLLFLAFGCFLGAFNALSTLVNQLVAPYNYSDNDSAIFGGVVLVSGIIMSGLVSLVLDKTKVYKTIQVVGGLGFVGSAIWLVFMLKPNNMGLLIPCFAFLGMFGMSLIPAGLETAVELVFPVPEGVVSGLLFLSGQAMGIINVLSMSAIQKHSPLQTHSARDAVWFLAGTLLLGTIFVLCMPPRYKRLQAEQGEKAYA